MKNRTRSEASVDAFELAKKHRKALMNANDINHILVHGAEISYSKLRRAGSHIARIYFFAEIGVYLEVSLSSSSGVTNDAREHLTEIHQKALTTLMDANKKEHLSGK
jgi:hypothetical protein